MAKFSVNGENGERGSSSRSKRLKTSTFSTSSSFRPQHQQQRQSQQRPEPVDEEEENNEEEQEEDDDNNEEEEEEEEEEDDGQEEEEEEEQLQDDDEEEDCDDDGIYDTIRNGRRRRGLDVNGSTPVTLMDTEVLDCSICYEPLTIPVFQCDNGHTACSSCCKKIANKCPSCSMPIGYNRCRAIEKVLESVKISCPNKKYGCKEFISYSKKCDHDKTCSYAACSCPLLGCNFLGSCKVLYQHFSTKHAGCAIPFSYDRAFPVFFTDHTKFLILQEEKEGILFILNNIEENLGNMIIVSCVDSSSEKGRHFFEVTAKMEGSTIKFQSFTKNIPKRVDKPPSIGFLLVPKDFFGSYRQITLELRIWRYGTLKIV